MSLFSMDIGLYFSFLVMFSSGFGIREMLISRTKFGSIPPLQFFFEEFEKDWCSFFFKYFIEFTREATMSWDFPCWKFFDASLLKKLLENMFL